MRKSRSYARRRLSASWWRFIRDNKPLFMVLVAVCAGTVGFALLTQPSRFVQGLVIGVATTVFTGFVVLVFLISTGSIYALAGSWGESFTNDEIKKAVKQGHVWGTLANLEIGGMDIDHLVIAPSGIFAIETKMHTARLSASRKENDIVQARDNARKASLVLRSATVKMPHEVTPVLVIWGKAAAELPDGYRKIDGVHVLRGANLPTWLLSQATGRIAQDTAEDMLVRLKAFRDTQIRRDPVLT